MSTSLLDSKWVGLVLKNAEQQMKLGTLMFDEPDHIKAARRVPLRTSPSSRKSLDGWDGKAKDSP